MGIKTVAALLAGCALSASGVYANEVIATQGQAKGGGNRLALDFMNSGGATAFEFEIVVPSGLKSLDTSQCLSEIPASHTGACKYNPNTGRVTVIVYSNENQLLPDDLVSLGWIGGIPASAGKGVVVEKLLVGDAEGKSMPVTSSAQSEAALREKSADAANSER